MFEMVEQKTEDFYCRTVPKRLSHHLARPGSATFCTTDLERLRLGVAEDDTHDTILPAIDAHHKLTNLTILHSTIAYTYHWNENVCVATECVNWSQLNQCGCACHSSRRTSSGSRRPSVDGIFVQSALSIYRYESNRIIEESLDRRYPEKKTIVERHSLLWRYQNASLAPCSPNI